MRGVNDRDALMLIDQLQEVWDCRFRHPDARPPGAGQLAVFLGHELAVFFARTSASVVDRENLNLVPSCFQAIAFLRYSAGFGGNLDIALGGTENRVPHKMDGIA